MVTDFLFCAIGHWEGKNNKNDGMLCVSLKLLSSAWHRIFFWQSAELEDAEKF